jgi:serine/threonine protein kinase
MDPDPVTLALDLTHRSPAEREARYAQLGISTALRAEVEALLLADAGMRGSSADNRSATREHPTHTALTPTDGTAPRTSTEGPVLRGIGRYEIVRLLGRGGNGDVYLAHDPVLDRDVAVKLIRGDFDDSVAHTRLVLEARAAGRLRHPNIVTIFDVGEHEGHPYIAMEHVPGETLRSIIRRQAELPLPRRLELVEGACAGLAHAHRAGVVHLDVKPDNLMLDESGIVKVLDFGIARVVRSETLVTNHNVGTLRYMSPEQVSGAPLDRRSDVFSLGASCFELVAYAPAYNGSTHEMITRIADGPVPRLLEVVPEVDPRLDEILARAMALDPMDRFEDLDDFRLELARLRLDMEPGTGVHLRSRVVPSGGVRAPSSSRSRVPPKPEALPWRPGVVAGLGVALIAVIGFGAFWANGPGPASSPDAANTPAANTPAANAPPPATGTLPGSPSASPPAASNGGDDVWRHLAIGDRAAVLRLLRPGETGDGPAANPRLASAVVDAVRASVSRAREAASASSASRSSPAYRRAEERFARANRLQADQQPLDALGALWQAADDYARVTTLTEPPAQTASGANAPAPTSGSTPGPAPAATGQGSSASSAALPGGPSRAAPGPVPVPVAPPVAPAPTPSAAEAASAAPPANADRSAAAVVPSDSEAVVAALRRYQDAYKALDVSGVLRVFPSLASNQVEQLRRTFAEMSAYEIEARQTRVEVKNDVATVRAVVARRMVPRVGRPLANEIETEFRLRREGQGWLITDVRAVR